MENYLQKYKQIDAVWTGDDDVLKGFAGLQGIWQGRHKVFLGRRIKDIIKMIMDETN